MTDSTAEGTSPSREVHWTALENTRLAYERTLMAWVRTAVSLIGFGFTIYKFFQYFQEEAQIEQVPRLITPRALGLFMISAGVFTLVLAALEHARAMKRLKAQYSTMPPSLALLLATIISVSGVLALLAAIFRQ